MAYFIIKVPYPPAQLRGIGNPDVDRTGAGGDLAPISRRVRRRVEKPARNGGKFAFLTLSDPTGEVELMVMPELLADMREQLEPGCAVVILTEVRRRDD